MCGQFGQSNVPEFISKEKQAELSQTRRWILNSKTILKPVVSPNTNALIVTNEGYKEAKFGFVLGKRQTEEPIFWFNARVEFWGNKENSSNFKGPFEIFNNQHLKEIIKTQRAVIPVSHFFENPPKSKNKYLIRKQKDEVIYLGGIWTEFINENTGELSDPYFCVLTTAANKATKLAKHPRCPVILEEADLDHYTNPKTSQKELEHYFKPNNDSDFLTFEIDPTQLKQGNLFSPNKVEDFNPIGPVVNS